MILNLKVVPEEVWDCGPSVRVLDISNNSIQEVPAKIGLLSSIQVTFCHFFFHLDEHDKS